MPCAIGRRETSPPKAWLDGTSSFSRLFCPMGLHFGPVATNGHAAPAACMPFRAVEEHQAAPRTFTTADPPEVLMTDQVRRRFNERINQLLRTLPPTQP